jgi:hypothetical protein
MYKYTLIRSIPRGKTSLILLVYFAASLSALDVFAEESGYNDPSGLLQEVIRGEKWRLRIQWENYF